MYFYLFEEFEGLKLIPKTKYGMGSVSTGEQVLENMGLTLASSLYKNNHKMAANAVTNNGVVINSVGRALKMQGIIVLVNYLFTFISLSWQKPSFEKLKPSPSSSSDTTTNTINNEASKDTHITASAVVDDDDDDVDDDDDDDSTDNESDYSNESENIQVDKVSNEFKKSKSTTTTIPLRL